MRKFLGAQLRIFFAGLLAMLPLALTLAAAAWVGSFVFADGAGRRDLDLIHANDGDVGEKPAAQGRFGCAIG